MMHIVTKYELNTHSWFYRTGTGIALSATVRQLEWRHRRAVAQRGKSRRIHFSSPGWTVLGSLFSTRAMCSITSQRGQTPSTTEPATMKSLKCRSLELQMYSWQTCRLHPFRNRKLNIWTGSWVLSPPCSRADPLCCAKADQTLSNTGFFSKLNVTQAALVNIHNLQGYASKWLLHSGWCHLPGSWYRCKVYFVHCTKSNLSSNLRFRCCAQFENFDRGVSSASRIWGSQGLF